MTGAGKCPELGTHCTGFPWLGGTQALELPSAAFKRAHYRAAGIRGRAGTQLQARQQGMLAMQRPSVLRRSLSTERDFLRHTRYYSSHIHEACEQYS